MKVLRIKDWSDHYENNRTKEMKDMRWVPIPNSHDGEGYCQMVAGKDGAAVLGAWVACVQVASRCEPRGTLIRKGGAPHNSESLAARTRLPTSAFAEMIKRATLPSVDWMELFEITDLAVLPQSPAEIPQSPAVSSFIPSIPSIPFPSFQEGMQGEKKPSATSMPPERSWIDEYMTKLGLAISEAAKFFDHYESQGWMVGKARMRNWQAACRNWKASPLRTSLAGGKTSTGLTPGYAAAIEQAERKAAENAVISSPDVAAAIFALPSVPGNRQHRAQVQAAKLKLNQLEG